MNSASKNKRKLGAKTRAHDDTVHVADLAAVDKLLATAAEMMTGASKLDRAAFEYLRRLRVAIRLAMSENQKVSRPGRVDTPHKWLQRSDKHESPIDFIRREYADALAQKSLTRADIRRVDPSLYTALYAWITKHGDLPDGFDLPKLSDANQRKIKEAGAIKAPRRLLKVTEMSPEDREQLRLYKLAQRQRNHPKE